MSRLKCSKSLLKELFFLLCFICPMAYWPAVAAIKPTVSLTANPSSVALHGKTVLTWSSRNATSCVARGLWRGKKALSGSETIGPLKKNQDLRLECKGPGGNTKKQVRVSVTHPDNVAPVISLLGPNPMNLELDESYIDPGVTAMDDPEGDLTAFVVVDDTEVNTASDGTYSVYYTVSDSAGNRALNTRMVIVGDQSSIEFPKPPVTQQLLAFPSAEGFGAKSIGGRGGKVCEVTNLDDAGPGSLRACLDMNEPRIVVFRVCGNIVLQSGLSITEPFVTIAGQSAPGGGITLTSDPKYNGPLLSVSTHDVVVRYMRFRPVRPNKIGCCGDSLTLNHKEKPVYNVIVDHCSLSWATDENASTWYNSYDITWQWNIFSEALASEKKMVDEGMPWAKGPLFGGRSRRLSFHHNLLAHNMQRNPKFSGTGPFYMTNNLVYNWRNLGTVIEARDGNPEVNLIGNVYKVGPDSSTKRYEVGIFLHETNSLYVHDNLGPHRLQANANEWALIGDYSDGPSTLKGQLDSRYRRDHPWPSAPIPVTIHPASQLESVLLNKVGSNLHRDAVDARIVYGVRSGTGKIIDDPAKVGGLPVIVEGFALEDSDHDGIPDDWEVSHGLNPLDQSDGREQAPSGYTWVEEYLNELTL